VGLTLVKRKGNDKQARPLKNWISGESYMITGRRNEQTVPGREENDMSAQSAEALLS
jgi:hypothetical protein